MSLVTKTYIIIATPDTLQKFERFLALMHYNAGHSGCFAMQFDGDGHERLNVNPAPDESFRNSAQKIGTTGASIEIALINAYHGRFINLDKTWYVSDIDGLRKENKRNQQKHNVRR